MKDRLKVVSKGDGWYVVKYGVEKGPYKSLILDESGDVYPYEDVHDYDCHTCIHVFYRQQILIEEQK